MICSQCGCCWDEDEYYTTNGEIEMPCKYCKLDAKSIHYVNNRDRILEAQREAYYANHEARKAYYREYRRQQRAQASA